MPCPCQSEGFLRLGSHPPPPPTLLEKRTWRGDCQHHTDAVTVGHTFLSLPSFCGCCLVFSSFYLSPSPAFSSLSPSLVLLTLPCSQSFSNCQFVCGHPGGTAGPTHIHRRVPEKCIHRPSAYSRDFANNRFSFSYFFLHVERLIAVLKSCSQYFFLLLNFLSPAWKCSLGEKRRSLSAKLSAFLLSGEHLGGIFLKRKKKKGWMWVSGEAPNPEPALVLLRIALTWMSKPAVRKVSWLQHQRIQVHAHKEEERSGQEEKRKEEKRASSWRGQE